MALGKPGAINAAILAVEILATSDAALAKKLADYKQELARSVAAKAAKVKRGFQL
jgi:phosphoribosylcarboxyaminoimidazole (NCAIR) mutase